VQWIRRYVSRDEVASDLNIAGEDQVERCVDSEPHTKFHVDNAG
jgi:hypothetical protein